MVNELIIIFVLIIFSAIFSSTETAYTSLSIINIRELLEDKNKFSQKAVKLTQNKDTLLTTILIGNNVVNISVSSLVTTFCIKYLGSEMIAYGTGVLTLVILIFGEVTPKQLAMVHSTQIAKIMSYPIFLLTIILFPIVWIIKSFGNFISKISSKGAKRGLTVEGILRVVDFAEEGGIVDEYESELVQKVLHFSENPIKTVMTHRKDVFLLKDELTIEEAFKEMVNSNFSRIPIYHDDYDNITGIILIRDVLHSYAVGNIYNTLLSIARKPIFVPETKHLDYIFFLFKKKNLQMAIVLDEYGGFSGIITMEDVAEQVIGEIYDEHEPAYGENIQKLEGEELTYLIKGETPFLQFCDELDIKYHKAEKVGTIAAYLIKITGSITEENEIILDKNGKYIIKKMSDKRIDEILFFPMVAQ
ncbi:MAG: HlyC/CorC family transporter [Spirochaetaceae bacterium]|nr:HlyC/CorC family transporter [Spirochaetaceae bacterium]